MNEVASAGACLTVIVSSEVRRVSLVREDAVITGAAAAAADLYRSTFAVPCDCEQMRLCESPSYTVYLYIENMIYVPEVLLIMILGSRVFAKLFEDMVHRFTFRFASVAQSARFFGFQVWRLILVRPECAAPRRVQAEPETVRLFIVRSA